MSTTDEVFLADEIKADIVRMLPNLHDEIAIIRARITNGESPNGAFITAAARGMLGRLKRMFDSYQEDQATFLAALGVLGISQAHFSNRLTSFRDTLRIFRDAPKNNNAQITASLNTLESSLPVQKRFLNKPLPSDWV